MSLGNMPKDKIFVDKMPAEKLSKWSISAKWCRHRSVDKMSADKMNVNKMIEDKMSVDKVSVDKVSVDKVSVDKISD